MTGPLLVLGLALTAQASASNPAPPANPVFERLRGPGVSLAGVRVTFPAPTLADGATADEERAALRRVAGSDRAVPEFTRDSVSAPVVMKLRDETAGDRGVVRFADVYFVVHARLDDLDPAAADGPAGEGKPVEAANMKFVAARVDARDLAARGITPADRKSGVTEWYVHLTGRLLDRILVEATDRITATRGAGSWVVGSLTDPRFDADKDRPNRWRTVRRRGAREESGPDEPYPGGASYVKLTTLSTVPGALLVEGHLAFFEPKAWFDGAPVLRSKISLVAQDRVRALRRELAKSRRGPGARTSSATGRG